jgi:hypothetical protein
MLAPRLLAVCKRTSDDVNLVVFFLGNGHLPLAPVSIINKERRERV